MSEKVRGKRVAADEPAWKKRKTAGAIPRKPGGISLGGDQTTRTRSAVMSEWLDDNEALVAPPLSTCTEEQPKGGEGVHEQQAKGVPEQQEEERPMTEATRPPPQGMWVDPRAAPRGSGRHHRFRKVYWEANT